MPSADRQHMALEARRLGATHQSLREVIADEVRTAILDGRFQPGERLVEDRLAAAYGVSRNPVREALRALEGEGLVVVKPRRGAFVATLSGDEAHEIIELRAALEGLSARLAARRGAAATKAQIADVSRIEATRKIDLRIQGMSSLDA